MLTPILWYRFQQIKINRRRRVFWLGLRRIKGETKKLLARHKEVVLPIELKKVSKKEPKEVVRVPEWSPAMVLAGDPTEAIAYVKKETAQGKARNLARVVLLALVEAVRLVKVEVAKKNNVNTSDPTHLLIPDIILGAEITTSSHRIAEIEKQDKEAGPLEAVTTRTLHELESHSRLFFDMESFGELLTLGQWEEAEAYLCGFTMIDEHKLSSRLFYEIRKQKYLEALDNKDFANAQEILRNELRIFFAADNEGWDSLSYLLTIDDIRESEGLSSFGNTKSTREILCATAKLLIEENPVFLNKLQSPENLASRSLGIKQVPYDSAEDAKEEIRKGEESGGYAEF